MRKKYLQNFVFPHFAARADAVATVKLQKEMLNQKSRSLFKK